MANNKGPITEPCSTPYFNWCSSEIVLHILIVCVRILRKDVSHFIILSPKPKQVDNRCNTRVWSMVSKPRKGLITLLQLIPLLPDLSEYCFQQTVELILWNGPPCKRTVWGYGDCVYWRYVLSWFATTFSSNIECSSSLRQACSFLRLFFWIYDFFIGSRTMAFLKSGGNMPSDRKKVYSVQIPEGEWTWVMYGCVW